MKNKEEKEFTLPHMKNLKSVAITVELVHIPN